MRRLIEFECRRARDFYQRAVDGAARRRIAGGSWPPRSCAAVYFETLRRIERSGLRRVHGACARAAPAQALIALRQWLWT